MPLPIERFQIETPQSNNIQPCLIIFAAEEVHHVIEDDSGVRVDITERVIVQEICDALRPYLVGDAVSVYRALLV